MPFGPDLHSLDSAAARLDQHATELRSRAARLHAATDSIDWRSAAASAFRQHNATVCGQLQRCADRLEHAATVLRRHADCARSRLEAAGAVVGAAEAVVGGAEHLVSGALTAIGGPF
jgi:hypothetical protein